MKSLALTLVFFISSQVWAISDFDRAVLFGANLYSMGTYIAQMEGEIARIKLSYEMKTAEFQKKLELDYQAYLKDTLIAELEYLKNQKAKYSEIYSSLQKRNAGFNEIIDLTQSVFKGLLTKEALLNELQRLNEVYPGIEFGTADLENLPSAHYETVVSNAIRLFANSKGLESEVSDQISLIELRISGAELQLKGLP
jgi:hypothetical protein